jgi:hypothetical protein
MYRYFNQIKDLDRFGNPNVSVGFPSTRPGLKSRSSSICDSLDVNLVEKSSNTLKEEVKRKQAAQKELV